MRRLLYILLIFLVFLQTACTRNKVLKHEPQYSDSLYTADAAMRIYDYNSERALVILDSAELVGNLPADEASFLRARVFTLTFEEGRLDSAQKICKNLMESDYVDDLGKQEEVLDLLISISRKKYDDEQCLKWATRKAELCREQNNEVEALRTEAEIAIILNNLGRKEEALSKLDEVISQLDDIGSVDRLDASIVAMRRKVSVLSSNDNYSEIIQIANRIVEKINHYEKYSDQYANDSYRLLPDSADRANYIEFCRTQAYGYLADAYANEGTSMDSARFYLALYEQSGYGQSFSGRKSISSTWLTMGEYTKALAIYDEMTSRMGTDTLDADYALILRGRAIAAEAKGNYRDASDYWRRYAYLDKQLSYQLQKSKAHEYAARYRAQEQQMEIDKFAIKYRMQKIIIIIMFMVMLVIVFFYNYTNFQKQKLTKKNAALVKLIDENVKQNMQMSNPREQKKNDICLSKACKLLSEQPDMKTSEVAKKVGLTLRNLQKLFREQYGISLTEYKASHKK